MDRLPAGRPSENVDISSKWRCWGACEKSCTGGRGRLTVKEDMLFLVRHWLGLASVVGALSVAGLAGPVTPASAAGAPSAHVGMVGIRTSALPNANIKGSPAKWSPTKLTVKPHNFTRCTKAKLAWTITNKTKKTQTILVKVGSKKQVVGKVKAGAKAGLCAEGPKGAKGLFFIKGSRSKLTVTLS